MRERAMAQLQQAAVRNRLLSGISPEDFDLLQPHLEPGPLDLRQWLIEAGEPIQHVTFPEHGIVSILADTSEGRIEVGFLVLRAWRACRSSLGSTAARMVTWSKPPERLCASPPRTFGPPFGTARRCMRGFCATPML